MPSGGVELSDYRIHHKRDERGEKKFYLDTGPGFTIGPEEFGPAGKFEHVEELMNGVEIWKELPEVKYSFLSGMGRYIITEEIEDRLNVLGVYHPISGGYGRLFIQGEDKGEVVWSEFLARAESIPEELPDSPHVPLGLWFHFYYYNYLDDIFRTTRDVLYLGDQGMEWAAGIVQRSRWVRDNRPEIWEEVVRERGNPFQTKGSVDDVLAHFEKASLYIGAHHPEVLKDA